jgi:CheY-like chemotaxis protein
MLASRPHAHLHGHASREAFPHTGPDATAPGSNESAEPQVRPTRVAVIDNRTRFADLLIGALSREADLHCIGHATGVESGIRLCLDRRPDVVIMDHDLGDGTGLQASERILAQQPATRILLLTANPAARTGQATGPGISAFLHKGGSLATLLQSLRNAADTTTADPAPSPAPPSGIPTADGLPVPVTPSRHRSVLPPLRTNPPPLSHR